ncbi:hypothetical protein ATANTOWER_018260 [Ataeniobius toweri]|uniref:Secreted protein n=1 Tax=Ataeniobius toweri TaxID=208326 RepID=A0ABU7BR72_9TELE|nr:hypothetical protein [Ataeniobius toweri]
MLFSYFLVLVVINSIKKIKVFFFQNTPFTTQEEENVCAQTAMTLELRSAIESDNQCVIQPCVNVVFNRPSGKRHHPECFLHTVPKAVYVLCGRVINAEGWIG